MQVIAEKCDRCGGGGVLPQFKHVDGGICYKCGGDKIVHNTYTNKQAKQILEWERQHQANEKSIEDRRFTFFQTLTVEKFKSLSNLQKNKIHAWAHRHTEKMIKDRYYKEFHPNAR